jgi:hypothetical protein
MTWDEVADLITQVPKELNVNEFLIALATKAAEQERAACIEIIHMEGMTKDDIVRVIKERGKK